MKRALAATLLSLMPVVSQAAIIDCTILDRRPGIGNGQEVTVRIDFKDKDRDARLLATGVRLDRLPGNSQDDDYKLTVGRLTLTISKMVKYDWGMNPESALLIQGTDDLLDASLISTHTPGDFKINVNCRAPK